MVVTEIFPTIFALRIGEEFNIIPKTKKNMTSKNHEELREKMEMMICFQQMAMACSLDDCMISFHGIKFNKLQLEKLSIIHRSTRSWILANNTATLLNKLQSPLISGRDAKDLTAAIVEHLQEKDTSGPNGQKKSSGFNVFMSSVSNGES